MLQIRTILHPTDFSTQAGLALRHAVLWTRRFDAALHLLHVLPGLGACRIEALDTAEAAGLVRPSLRDDIAHLMADTLSATRADDLPVRCFVAQSPLPAGAVLAHARAVDADLVVMGRRGCSSDAPRLGSAAAEVMRRSSCPVLMVDEHRDPRASMQALRRLAVYVDCTRDARDLVEYAAALVGQFRADVDLVYVIPTLAGEAPSVTPAEEPGAEQARVFAEGFGPFGARADDLRRVATAHAVALRLHVGRGYPPEVLAAFMREHASDLLLMHAPGLSTAEYASTKASAERIVHHAPCPVLLLNPSGKPLVTPSSPSSRSGSSPPPRSLPSSSRRTPVLPEGVS